eukprot:scaffold1420_cov375-Pavlova_lutheri.AAC.28
MNPHPHETRGKGRHAQVRNIASAANARAESETEVRKQERHGRARRNLRRLQTGRSAAKPRAGAWNETRKGTWKRKGQGDADERITNDKALQLDPGDSAELAVYKDGMLCAFSSALFVAAAKDEEILQVDTIKAVPKKQVRHSTAIALSLLSLCTTFALYRPRSTKELLLGFVAVGICLYTATHMLMPPPKAPRRKLNYQPQVKVEPVPETPKVKDTRGKAAFYSAIFTMAGIALLKIEGSFSYLSRIGAMISFVQASILGYPVIAIMYKVLLKLFARVAPPQVASKLDQLCASVS